MLQKEKRIFSWLESLFDEWIKNIQQAETEWAYCKETKESGKYTVFDFFVHVVKICSEFRLRWLPNNFRNCALECLCLQAVVDKQQARVQ